MFDRRRATCIAVAVPCCLALAPGAALAQRDSVTVQAGAHYEASGLKEDFLGPDYRDFWTTPIRVPVLDLRSYAGGLTPVQRGGGNQTVSLRFAGADGREYTFRSVDKNPRLSDEPALIETVVGDIIQDQVSSLHPAAALMVPPILEAIGVLHPRPLLAVMPDDPALGEFRAEYAGMLGMIEERPDEREGDRPGFGGFTKIVATETLFERLEESPRNQVKQAEYLTARLADLMLGDWDRHADQWRWAEVERGGVTYYRPIPRDRDYAFVDYDGWVMVAGRSVSPNAVRYTRRFELSGLTLNARELDHRFLTGLERAEWDSVTAFIRSRVTDAVIDEAMRRVPPEFLGPTADDIAATLRWRRDHLGEAAASFYETLATEVDVRGTDEPDLAVVDRGSDGTVRVRLFPRPPAGDSPTGQPSFDRVFRADETHEVRVYLHGGDDRAVARGGAGESLFVRLIGGGGDDLLVDSSTVSGLTAFHDDDGDNTFVRGPGTKVETREYDPPDAEQALSGESFRDWGSLWNFTPSVNYQSTDGLILGFGRAFTRFGFRKVPYAYRVAADGRIGLGNGAMALRVSGDLRRTASRDGLSFQVEGTQLDPIHFYGFGNDTEAAEPSSFYVVRQNRLTGWASWYKGIGERGRISAGPIVKFTRTQLPEGRPFSAAHTGNRTFGQIGAQTRLVMDWRDELLFPRSGAVVDVGGSGYPAVWDANEEFGEVHAVASTYLTPGEGLSPTLALRVGGKHLWGDAPIHESAFLGGSATVRGYSFERFAGDAMVFGSAEARMPLARVRLLVRGDLGVLALADAGRVYLDGESPEGWHTAYGGGLWFRFQVRSTLLAASASYAYGERGIVYLKLGLPF